MRSRSILLAFLLLAPRALAEPRRLEPATDAELARSTRLETVLRVALERNRELAEIRARADAAEARGRAAGRLPDLELKSELWAVPLARPLALAEADTIMVGLRQSFPAWGTLDARGRAGNEEAAGAQETARARRQDVAAQVHRTFATYYRADQEVRLHLEHVGLTSRLLELAKVNQRTGHGELQDVLRLQIELTRLHTDVGKVEREMRSSRALLNALMDREPDAPLGPPEALEVTPTVDVAGLEKGLDTNRAEIAAAGRALRRDEASLVAAQRAARLPGFMIGLDYWFMPMGTEVRHAYGAMVSMNLPWLSGRRRDEEAEAEHTLRAEQHALQATRNAVRYELRDAAARVESARQSFNVIDQDLLVQARRSLEATQASYAAGRGDALGLLDALRSYLQLRIERVRALAELATSEADLRRAAGVLATNGGAR
jgi:cobalt-zinc-cadmium efflux system outer membrane protein